MKFYTSVLPYRGRLLVRGVIMMVVIKNIELIIDRLYLCSANKESKYKTLDGRNAGKIDFDSISDAKKWIDEYEDVSGFEYFGNTRYQYPFIADQFPDKIDWDIKQIRTNHNRYRM